MTAKETLGQLKEIDKKIDACAEDLKRLRLKAGMLEPLSFTHSGVRPKVVADATAAAATGIAEAEGRLAAQVDAYLSARAEAERLIEAMPEGNGRLVLYLWYVVGMKPRAIAKRMGYSADHVFRLHRLAIKELSKIAKDASKCQ